MINRLLEIFNNNQGMCFNAQYLQKRVKAPDYNALTRAISIINSMTGLNYKIVRNSFGAFQKIDKASGLSVPEAKYSKNRIICR